MTYLEGFILGITQGLTEFIPVSSTGHLILVREWFNYSEVNGLAIDAVLQLATVLAILVYFWRDLWNLFLVVLKFISGKVVENESRQLLLAIIFGTIPALILGLLLQNYMETTFRSANFVAFGLIVGSIIFFFAEKIARGNKTISLKNGFFIGLFQALALFPGISRSGATISGGLMLGLSRVEAARFSFILSFPIIAGSGILKLYELTKSGIASSISGPLILGFVSAFFVGILAIDFLIKYLRGHRLTVFIYYRIFLAALIILFLN